MLSTSFTCRPTDPSSWAVGTCTHMAAHWTNEPRTSEATTPRLIAAIFCEPMDAEERVIMITVFCTTSTQWRAATQGRDHLSSTFSLALQKANQTLTDGYTPNAGKGRPIWDKKTTQEQGDWTPRQLFHSLPSYFNMFPQLGSAHKADLVSTSKYPVYEGEEHRVLYRWLQRGNRPQITCWAMTQT